MEINRGATLDPGRIMVEQCKSDNYETSYITSFVWPWLVMTTRVLTITRR